MKSKIQNPKSEGSPRSEARSRLKRRRCRADSQLSETCATSFDITRETRDQIPDDRRSKPITNRRRSAGPPRGNPMLSELTKPLNCPAVSRGVTRDAPDWRERFGSARARPAGCAAAGFGRVTKIFLIPWMSRVPVELFFRDFSELLRIFFVLSLHFIQQFLQRGTRTRIANNPLPFGVAVQLRYQGRQILRQLLPVFGRERTDGSFDFLNRAHGATLPHRPIADKSPCEAEGGQRTAHHPAESRMDGEMKRDSRERIR